MAPARSSVKSFFTRKIDYLKENPSQFLVIVFGLIIIGYALFSSNGTVTRIKKAKDLYSLISPSLIFMFVTALKLLAGFWIFAIAISIFNWNHISEQGAKIFGIEINQKFDRQELNKARVGVNIIQTQIKLLSDLNKYIYTFSVSDFKETVLESDSVPDKVREIIKSILVRAYQNNFPEVEIFVLHLNNESINKLDPRISAPVKMLIDKEENDLIWTEYDTLGIGVHRGFEGLETLVIIDTSKEGYDISLAEIETAGNLFLSIANVIVN